MTPYQSTIAFDTPVNLVWLVGLATVTSEDFAAVDAQSLDSIVYRPLERGGILDPQETGDRIWEDFYQARSATKLRQHAQELKRLLGRSGNVTYVPQGLDLSLESVREHVYAVESLNCSSSFGDLEYRTDGKSIQIDCQVKGIQLRDTADLGNLTGLSRFALPKSSILQSMKDTQFHWYFLVELQRPLKGNATGVRETGGSNGRQFSLVLLERGGTLQNDLYATQRVPKVILHDRRLARESVCNILRRWQYAYAIWNRIEDQLDLKLRISDEKHAELVKLLRPLAWWSSRKRIGAAHSLARLQIYVSRNQNSLDNLNYFKKWLDDKWALGSIERNGTRIYVGSFVNNRQVSIYEENPKAKSFEDGTISAFVKAKKLERQIAHLNTAIGPIASSYQTQSSTAAETIGLTSALVALFALGLAGFQYYSSMHDPSRSLNTAAACSQLSKSQQKSFSECTKSPK